MSTWDDFLTTQQRALTQQTVFSSAIIEKSIMPLAQFLALEVSGQDAASFLQGQLTSNVKNLSQQQAQFTALCDAKGKVLTTLLLIKQSESVTLILPASLAQGIKTRLERYILRAKVSIAFADYGFFGRHSPQDTECAFQTVISEDQCTVYFGNRALILVPAKTSEHFWQTHLASGFEPVCYRYWQWLDIQQGIPWLTPQTTEQFVPQMLNIDTLGGISYDKGCYTGQEIVARTHYLGTIKRRLHRAIVKRASLPLIGEAIRDQAQQVVGKILMAEQHDLQQVILLLVLANDQTWPLFLGEDRLFDMKTPFFTSID